MVSQVSSLTWRKLHWVCFLCSSCGRDRGCCTPAILWPILWRSLIRSTLLASHLALQHYLRVRLLRSCHRLDRRVRSLESPHDKLRVLVCRKSFHVSLLKINCSRVGVRVFGAYFDASLLGDIRAGACRLVSMIVLDWAGADGMVRACLLFSIKLQ